MLNIKIQQWDEERFLNSEHEWNDLLKRSDADPLFLSWEWQSSWWRFFSDKKDMHLRLFVACTDDGKLLGIAPLYSTRTSIKGLIQVVRLQFIGNCWRGKSTMPTELLSFIADKSAAEDIIRSICCHINNLDNWDEFVIPYLNTSSVTYSVIMNDGSFASSYKRHAESFYSYYLKTTGHFQDYKQRLGKNTRLKLINRRKNLQQAGKAKFRRGLTDKIDEHFELLNKLHEKRWGQPAFKNKRLEFNKTVALLMANKNNLNFSVISLDDVPISIQYNYVVNQHNYNIQAGFDENLLDKVSLGYLHFGYEIEACFDQDCNAYDFLAGEGKNIQYKERLTDDSLQMVDLQIIRGPLISAIYRMYDLRK